MVATTNNQMLARIRLVRFFSNSIRKIDSPEITPEKEKQAKLAQAAMLRVQQARYANKERQKRYHSNSLSSLMPGKSMQPSQKALNKKLLDAESIEKLLNTYDSNRFYLSNYQLLTALSQFVRLVPDYLKERSRVMKQGGKPKRYDPETDMRLAAIISQLNAEKEKLTPSEAVFASWILAKGDRYLDTDYLSVQIIENLTENSLPLLTTKDLSVLMWSMAKIDSKRKQPLGRLAIEFEKRFKKRMELREQLFSTEESSLNPEQEKNEEIDPNLAKEEDDYFSEDEQQQDAHHPEFMRDNAKYRQNLPFSVQSVCMYMWSLGKLNIVDTELTGPIFECMIDEGVVEKLSLLQIQMIVPSIVSVDFNCREQLLNRIFWRLDTFLKMSAEESDSSQTPKPLGNQLALKTLLTLFPKLHKILPCRNLFISLLKAYFKADPSPSPRFLTEILWSCGQMNLDRLPPKVCRLMEDNFAANIRRFAARDLSAALYTVGLIVRRKAAGTASEVSLDVNKLAKLLVNELAIKREFMNKRDVSMVKEVKAEIAAHCAFLNKVIE